jgi:hypothetical protein
MSPLEAALWALLGASTIEAFEVLTAIRSAKGVSWPWPRGELGPNLLAMTLRFGMACGLGAAMSEQFSGRFAAYIVGVGAPLILARIIMQLRTSDQASERGDLDEVGT